MKSHQGRLVRIYKYSDHGECGPIDTGKIGFLLKIDVHNEHVMVENEDGNIIKLFYKLVKLV